MKTKCILVIIFLTPYFGVVFSQNEKYLTLELGGIGGLGSLNYESVFSQKDNVMFSFRTGFSFMPVDKNNGVALIFPQMCQGTIGQNSHKADLGIGLSPSFTTNLGGAYVRMPLLLGYRFEPTDKNYYLRIAYTPLTSFLFDLQWQHWAGLTYAYKLNKKRL